MKSAICFVLALCSVSALTAGCGEPSITALSSPKADTLFLSNDEIGRLIADTWAKKQRSPVILFCSQEELRRLAKDPRYRWNEEKKKYTKRYDD